MKRLGHLALDLLAFLIAHWLLTALFIGLVVLGIIWGVKKTMESLIGYLNIALVFLQSAKAAFQIINPSVAEGLGRIINEIQLFISTHPQIPSTQAKGLTATVAFCNNILQSFAVLVASPLPKAEKIIQGEILLADLLDESKIYQAKKGKDADVLKATKLKAAEKLELIKNQ